MQKRLYIKGTDMYVKTSLWLVTLLLVSVPTRLTVADELLCDCTEPECLSNSHSRVCVSDTDKGCYMEFFIKKNPPVTMGCVRVDFFCDNAMLKPDDFPDDGWPHVICCFSNHCNRHLKVPQINSTQAQYMESTIPQETAMDVTSDHIIHTPTILHEDVKPYNNTEDVNGFHPVFVLLVVLALVFLVVVVASMSVIVRLWFIRAQKAQSSTTDRDASDHQIHLLPSALPQTYNTDDSKPVLSAGYDVP